MTRPTTPEALAKNLFDGFDIDGDGNANEQWEKDLKAKIGYSGDSYKSKFSALMSLIDLATPTTNSKHASQSQMTTIFNKVDLSDGKRNGLVSVDLVREYFWNHK